MTKLGAARQANITPRLTREKVTVQAMIRMYCAAKHDTGTGLCPACAKVSEHAARKIERCPFHEAKPVCADCRIHCYSKEMRDQIRAIMRYAGPRMMLRHPVLAVLHLVDGLRRPVG